MNGIMSVIITPPALVNTDLPGCFTDENTPDEIEVSQGVLTDETVIPDSTPQCYIVGVLSGR